MLHALLLMIFLLAGPLVAQGDPGLMSAAGRIEKTVGEGTCSAALIAPDLIATAAHCGKSAKGLVFRPGGKIGLPAFEVTDVLRHPLYDDENDPLLWKFRFDMAVFRLGRPVPPDIAKPFSLGDDATLGEDLFLISWVATPQPRQRKCRVRTGYRGLVTLGCSVSGGESGAPVVRMTESGPKLVAIVSSRATLGVQPVAQASNVRLRLPPLIRELQ